MYCTGMGYIDHVDKLKAHAADQKTRGLWIRENDALLTFLQFWTIFDHFAWLYNPPKMFEKTD